MMPAEAGGATRFAIRVDPAFRGLFSLLGAGRMHDYVELGPDGLAVRLGWMFRADIPRTSLGTATHHADMYGGWGAHGWAGRWLVNGSSKGIVEVPVTPPSRASLLGIWPIRLRTLYVSLEDPDTFLAALAD